MADTFKSGVRSIPVGVDSFNVTGFGASFTPGSVQVSVRQPSAEADIITAYVAGSITADGFTAVLSSPPSVTGYLLDFTMFGEGADPTPVASDSLSVSYNDLKQKVAYFLGWNPDALSAAETLKVHEIIQSGLRRFYYPPAMEGVDVDFEWSFIKQSGSLVTEANVGEYTMPNGFNRICGSLTRVGGDGGELTVPVIPYGDIKAMIAGSNGRKGKPRFASVAAVNEFSTRGQKRKIYLYPTPDAVYTYSYRCDTDQGTISTNNPFPLGGAMYSELIIESCLAVAEQTMNDEAGQHTAMFNSLLVSTIQRDRKASAHEYGKVGDPKHRRFW